MNAESMHSGHGGWPLPTGNFNSEPSNAAYVSLHHSTWSDLSFFNSLLQQVVNVINPTLARR